MEGLGVAANVIAVVDLSVKVASVCLQYAKDVKNAAADIDQLREEVTNLERVTKQVQGLLKGPDRAKLENSQSLDDALKRSRSSLQGLDQRLKPKSTSKAMRKFGLRAFKWPFQREEVERLIQELRQRSQTISLTLQVDQTGILLEVDRNVVRIDQHLLSLDQKTLLSMLPTATGASFDSRDEEHNAICLPNTRVDLLRQIQEWASDADAKALFWLNGMAGTGKSTISRTTCRQFAQSGLLGSSFFFKKGEADRGSLSRFFTTVAAQLAQMHPTIAPHIKSAVDGDPSISGKASQEQFEKLIKQPLGHISLDARRTSSLVFVIDALDECDRDEDAKLLINLFSCCTKDSHLKLKVLITSRPELPIRLGFSAVEGTYQDLVLHEIPHNTIEHDIATFLKHELIRIKTEYNYDADADIQLPSDWPGEQNIQILVRMALPLFIFAATVCRFIADWSYSNPDDLMNEFLESPREISQLDATYRPVLKRLIENKTPEQEEKVINRFRCIVGSITILARPLSKAALGQLLNVRGRIIYDQLKLLHSVLSIPSSDQLPVRLLHLSFRDFLVDPKKQGENRFWVDKKDAHRKMVANCLRVMDSHLRTDICQLCKPGTNRLSIAAGVVESHVPSELQYACLYWVYHIQQAEMVIDNCNEIYTFLQCHFLHWLEVLSLIGRASESLNIIKVLRLLLNVEGSRSLDAFLQDSLRLIQTNLATINATPLQIYSSILVFTPKNSLVRQAFQGQIPKWISLAPEPENDWDQCHQILEGHKDWVTSVCFSPDGMLVASGSDDKTVRVWNRDDGACVQELEGHKSSVTSVCFSPDSMLVASGSHDETVRIWNRDDGACVQELKDHKDAVTSVCFSPDGMLVASGSHDKTVRIWNRDDGACVQELKDHEDWVTSVCFSLNGMLVASGSYDKTVRIWNKDDSACVDNNACLQELKGHESSVTSVCFSPDGMLVASGSYDETVRIWNRDDGACVQELKDHKDAVTSVCFSPDGMLVASGSPDKTVRIRNRDDGACVRELKGHEDPVTSVCFSPDGMLVASGSLDKTVRIWNRDGGACVQELKDHKDAVTSVCFSPDGMLVASGSPDKMVRVWNRDDGACVQELEGHKSSVTSVCFSPDGMLVASGSYDKTVRIWNRGDGACVQELEGHKSSVTLLCFSPDSMLVASGSYDKTVRIWNRDDGTCVQELEGHQSSVTSLCFSPDSMLVASGSPDKTVRIWNKDDSACVDNNACLQELKGHESSVTSVCFSPDGMLVASGSHDKTVRIWNRDDGACVQELEGHEDWVTSVCFSPDGMLVASGSYDKTVRIWNKDGGACIQKIQGIRSSRVQFDPSGLYILSDSGSIALCTLALSSRMVITPFSKCLNEVGINSDGSWILWHGTPIFWLPVPFRGYYSAVWGSTVALGCHSGRVIIMRFEDPDV